MPENPYISSSVAARFYIRKSQRTIQLLCQRGFFKTARKIGIGKNSHWQIARTEVAQKSKQLTDAYA